MNNDVEVPDPSIQDEYSIGPNQSLQASRPDASILLKDEPSAYEGKGQKAASASASAAAPIPAGHGPAPPAHPTNIDEINGSLVKERNALRTRVRTLEVLNQNLELKVRAVSATLKEKHDQIIASSERIGSAETEERLRAQLKEATAKLTIAEERAAHLEAIVSKDGQFKERSERLTRAADELRDMLVSKTEYEQKCAQLTRAQKELSEATRRAAEQADKLARFADIDGLLTKYENDISSLLSHNQFLETNFANLKVELEVKCQDLFALQNERTGYGVKIDAANRSVHAAEARLAKAKKDQEILLRENKRLNALTADKAQLERRLRDADEAALRLKQHDVERLSIKAELEGFYSKLAALFAEGDANERAEAVVKRSIEEIVDRRTKQIATQVESLSYENQRLKKVSSDNGDARLTMMLSLALSIGLVVLLLFYMRYSQKVEGVIRGTINETAKLLMESLRPGQKNKYLL